MVATVDLYAILGVEADADRAVLRAAYRRLARVHHPDVGGSGKEMTLLNEAWSVLGSTASRHAYDQQRAAAPTAEVVVEGYAPAEPEPDVAAGPLERREAYHNNPASGTVLDFGHYCGWSLSDIARHDPDYLLWLVRVPIGRRHEAEIRATLNDLAHVVRASPSAKPDPRRLFHWR